LLLHPERLKADVTAYETTFASYLKGFVVLGVLAVGAWWLTR
jgi:hypothetical protein